MAGPNCERLVCDTGRLNEQKGTNLLYCTLLNCNNVARESTDSGNVLWFFFQIGLWRDCGLTNFSAHILCLKGAIY